MNDDLFVSRAIAVGARVSKAADESDVARILEKERAEKGASHVGVAHAALGIAETGTCVVETDSEDVRLETMVPETSVIVLRARDIVPGLKDAAGYLRGRQADGKVSYTSFITGPSRTADIERVGAIGVHGPLELHIILQEG